MLKTIRVKFLVKDPIPVSENSIIDKISINSKVSKAKILVKMAKPKNFVQPFLTKFKNTNMVQPYLAKSKLLAESSKSGFFTHEPILVFVKLK